VQWPSGHCTTLWSIVASFATDESGFDTPFVVAAAPPIVAVASAVFDCEPGRASPGLPTRTATLTLRASSWLDCASALAFAPFAFAFELALLDCPTPPSSPALFTRTDTFVLLGDCCPAFADASLDPVALPVVPADASAFAPFDCDTGPLSPGRSTRTDAFEFAGLVCAASAFPDACEELPVCAALSFACAVGDAFAFAAGFADVFADGFGLPFSLTGSADDVGAFVAELVSGALPDDVAGVSFVDAVVFDDASDVGAVGGSAAHAAVPHASVTKTAKTTRSAACVRFRSRSRGPSIRPLVPSAPHAWRLRSRARSTCLLHLHFLESMGTPSFSTRACAAPSLLQWSTSRTAASGFFHHLSTRVKAVHDPVATGEQNACNCRLVVGADRKFQPTGGFSTRHALAKGAFMTAVEIDRPETEDERVARWRIDQLARAGYDRDAATLIADARHVDLHEAVELVRHGCPVDTALRILL